MCIISGVSDVSDAVSRVSSVTSKCFSRILFQSINQNLHCNTHYTHIHNSGHLTAKISDLALGTYLNTPGTRGWSRLRDRTLAVAKNRAKMTFFSGGGEKLPKKNIFFLHISSSYAKILGETNFHAREIPRSG